MERRLTDSMETALQLGDGTAIVDIVDGPSLSFSQAFACPVCDLSFDELQPRNFSFNSPYGACQDCSGIGTKYQVDADLVVPQPDLSLSEGAIAPWRGRHRMTYYQRLISSVAEVHGMDMDAPWSTLDDGTKNLLLRGGGEEAYTVRYENRFGRQRSYDANYEGALNWIERRYQDSERAISSTCAKFPAHGATVAVSTRFRSR